MTEVQRATARLLATARTLDGAGRAAPSLCPGWTRGHVLAHVARNADGCTNLLTWARTGVETPQYASADARESDIKADAPRPLDEQLDDLAASAQRFAEAASTMPAAAWFVTIRWMSGATAPAAQVPWSRLREVEVHHVDLDAGYGPADWSESFTQRLIHEASRTLSGLSVRLEPDGANHPVDVGEVDDATPRVSGPAHVLAAWLIGRGDGAGITVIPDGPLPAVPSWK
jgi:maleylpyruvate isomerase